MITLLTYDVNLVSAVIYAVSNTKGSLSRLVGSGRLELHKLSTIDFCGVMAVDGLAMHRDIDDDSTIIFSIDGTLVLSVSPTPSSPDPMRDLVTHTPDHCDNELLSVGYRTAQALQSRLAICAFTDVMKMFSEYPTSCPDHLLENAVYKWTNKVYELKKSIQCKMMYASANYLEGSSIIQEASGHYKAICELLNWNIINEEGSCFHTYKHPHSNAAAVKFKYSDFKKVGLY